MLQHLNVFLVVRGPKLNTVFEVQPHQCQVKGYDHFHSPAEHTISDINQDAFGLLGHLGTLLAHIQLAVQQHLQVLFHRKTFQPLFPKPVTLHGVVVPQVQGLALGPVELHTIGLIPLIQLVQIPQSSPSRGESMLRLWQLREGPGDWKRANAAPMFMKVKNEDLGNYRLVSLISIPEELVEQLILGTISSHTKDRKVIRSSHHGMMKKKSHLANPTVCYKELTSLVDEGRAADAAYCNFSKAFDTVSDNIID
ncbi:rna-directed dna polymerase from mobile element jockey- hypothetical protein [Limosa lapponica baueri]|uniref:Rna-directed dna polymerase from mobile element jockey-like n=1 Tax=Limosa lapponica baueri TaxID=1758121 RepID=A0A2I0U4X3_LIMLA|nr:rna-directed dna polymerase from mobile element jockey- hypothetical protein [Limosa lapponica baueri]